MNGNISDVVNVLKSVYRVLDNYSGLASQLDYMYENLLLAIDSLEVISKEQIGDNGSFEELKRAVLNGLSSYDINTENKVIQTSVFEHGKNNGEGKDAISILFDDEKVDNNYRDSISGEDTKWELYLYSNGTWEVS